MIEKLVQRLTRIALLCTILVVSLLSLTPSARAQPAAASVSNQSYKIGPGDELQIFVWRNPDLSTSVPVRPDGKISIPLVEDIDCAGKTPSQLARDIETKLAKFVTSPNVTILVHTFAGSYDQEVRIVGEAVQPKAIPYKANMSVLDAMIEVGGITRYAAGNRATLVRSANGTQTTINVKLDNLLKDGDVAANIPLQPGDVIIIPQSFF